MPGQISDKQHTTKSSPKQAKLQSRYSVSPASHGRYIINIAGMRYILDTETGCSGTISAGRS
jgi:hypothetical protein